MELCNGGLPIDCIISDHAPTRRRIIHNGLEPISGEKIGGGGPDLSTQIQIQVPSDFLTSLALLFSGEKIPRRIVFELSDKTKRSNVSFYQYDP